MVTLLCTSLTIALSLAGAWFLWRGLAWHPHPGHRACRRCAYEMDGINGLQCPECGFTHKTEAKLTSTRIRRRTVGLSMLCLACACGAAVFPTAYANGAWSIVPRPVLIVLLPTADSRSSGVGKEISARLSHGFWNPQSLTQAERFLVRRTARQVIGGFGSEVSKALAARLMIIYAPESTEAAVGKEIASLVLARAAQKLGTCESASIDYTTSIRSDDAELPYRKCHASIEYDRQSRRISGNWREDAPDSGAAVQCRIEGTSDRASVYFPTDDLPIARDVPMNVAIGVFSGTMSAGRPWLLQLFDRVSASEDALSELRSPTVTGLETLGDKECFVITGTWSDGRATTVWIDASSFQLCQFSESIQLRNKQVTAVSTITSWDVKP